MVAPVPSPSVGRDRVRSFWFVVLVPAVIGFGGAWLAVEVAERYGAVLFLVLPFSVSFLAGFFHSYKTERSRRHSFGMAILSILVLGALIFLSAMDGLICLLMALPLAVLLAWPGALIGNQVGRAAGRRGALVPLLMCGLFPFLVAFEKDRAVVAPVRDVVTVIEVNASAGKVWETVIAFPRIHSPKTGIFRFGIACPVEARIEGEGVGAVRYCTFTTGDFVEPITAWIPGKLLAFDVTSSPLPMEEISIYDHIDAPHLHGHLKSHRGQFRIEATARGVRLEGTTWYSHQMWPQWYWAPVSDAVIHAIHQRVLEHIKTTAEAN
jgi:hypothetical protein